MEKLGKVEKLFEKTEQEIQDVLVSMNNKTQLVDINIANILGIKQPEIVFLIRKLLFILLIKLFGHK